LIPEDGDLAVSLRHDAPDPLPLGQSMTLTATVTNLGNSAANDVMLKDVLPPLAVIFEPSPGCSWADGTVICPIDTIPPGQSKEINIALKPKNQGDYTHRVSVSAIQSDKDISNNTATSIMHVAYSPSVSGGTATLSPQVLLIMSVSALMIALFRRFSADSDAGC